MKKFIIYFIFLVLLPSGLAAQITVTVGSSGTEYLNLTEAFDDINAGNITGDIILQIIDDCIEPGTATLDPFRVWRQFR